MNKKCLFACVFAVFPLSFNAAELKDAEPLMLNVGYWDPTIPTLPVPKSPIQIPLVYQDGNTLTFATPCTGCTVELLDSDGEVVYSDIIATGTTLVNLPDASLLGGSGTYELRLVYGSYYFYADITL